MKTSAILRRGRGKARRAAHGSAIEAGARAGFVARGVIYFLVGMLALRIAFHDGGGSGDGAGGAGQADRGGALSTGVSRRKTASPPSTRTSWTTPPTPTSPPVLT
ncbi:DUF1206 domain-containing protein, partial [Streptomyces sp. NPDC002346]